MFPVLFSIGQFQFQTLWLFILLAILIFGFIIFQQCEEKILPADKVFDAIIIAVIFGLILGRIVAILIKFGQINFWGAIFGALISLKFILGKLKLSPPVIADIISLASIPAATIYSLGKLIGFQFSPVNIFTLAWYVAGLIIFAKSSKRIQFPAYYLVLAAIQVGLSQTVIEILEPQVTAKIFNLTISILVLTIATVSYYLKSKRNVFRDTKMIGGKAAQTFTKVKQYLLGKRKTLEEQLGRLKKDDPFLAEGREQSRESGDDAYESEGHERISVVREDLKRALFQVKKALAAVGLGKYGKCERCGVKIDSRRLEVYPQATLCLSCEKTLEKS